MTLDLYTPSELPTHLASYTGGPVYTNNGVSVREVGSREGSDTPGGSGASITWLVTGVRQIRPLAEPHDESGSKSAGDRRANFKPVRRVVAESFVT